MVTGNILYKAINKHSFNWQFVPRNLEEKKKSSYLEMYLQCTHA